MRNVIYAINVSLDGCCDHTKFNPPDDDEVLEHYTRLLRDFDLLVYGRKTYQLMVPYWPDIAKSGYRICSNLCLQEEDCFFTIVGQR
jgi:dihydrofolate reductase